MRIFHLFGIGLLTVGLVGSHVALAQEDTGGPGPSTPPPAERLMPRIKDALQRQQDRLRGPEDGQKPEGEGFKGPRPTSTTGGEDRVIRADIRARLSDAKKEFEQGRTDLKQAVRKGVDDLKEVIDARREEAKTIIESRRESFKLEIDARREEAKQNREEIRTQLQEKVKEIKDGAKQQAVLRIDENLQTINENRVKFFTAAVDRIERVLDMIESRADKAEANGKDVSAVRTKLAAAADTITAARAAIATQAGKTYQLNVTDETKLGTSVSATRDQVKKDLDVVRASVKAAQDAARAAAQALGAIPGIKDVEAPAASTSTTSTTQN